MVYWQTFNLPHSKDSSQSITIKKEVLNDSTRIHVLG